MMHDLAHFAVWDPNNPRDLLYQMIPGGFDLYYTDAARQGIRHRPHKADPAQPPTTAGEELDDLQINTYLYMIYCTTPSRQCS